MGHPGQQGCCKLVRGTGRTASKTQRQQCSPGSGKVCQLRPPRGPPLQARHTLLQLSRAELLTRQRAWQAPEPAGVPSGLELAALCTQQSCALHRQKTCWLEPACAHDCRAAGVSRVHLRVQHCLRCPQPCMLRCPPVVMLIVLLVSTLSSEAEQCWRHGQLPVRLWWTHAA